MPTLRRILVPIDFSESSEAALAYARMLAPRFGAELHLVHVFEDPYAAAVFLPEVYGVISPELSAAARAVLNERLAGLLTSHDVSQGGRAAIVHGGAPATAITDYAATDLIDLIVIGTHGRRGLAHALLGSVAEKVVRSAPCPVLTVRQPVERASQEQPLRVVQAI